MAERDAKKGKVAGWFESALTIAIFLFFGLTMASVYRISYEIERATDVYLCIEVWKLGERVESCDAIMGRGEQ